MILPIIAYGDPLLKKPSQDISRDYPDLDGLIQNMFETMYQAKGVGLAAPQVGLNLRLFIVDGAPFADEEGEEPDPRAKGIETFKQVFINPKIIEEFGEPWSFQEGCLSIPKIRENVSRKESVVCPTITSGGSIKKKPLMVTRRGLYNTNTTILKGFYSPIF